MKNARIKIIIISAIVAIAILVTTLITISIASTNSGIAKSVTFTDDIEGAYVYFRAVDVAGNVGEWSEPQRIWIDTKAPNVSAKESSVTIEEGTVATLEDYFTVEANGGNTDIDVVCTIGGVEYTDTETLTAEGSPYTVVCEASKNGGNSKSAEMELVVEKSAPEPWDGTVATSFARGSGTEADPYIIETPQQLAYLASTTNAGTTYEGVYFEQGADLDLGGVQASNGTWSGKNWTSIGNNIYPAYASFGGKYDGGGFEILNLYCVNSGTVGLFGYLRSATIDNVTVRSGYVEQLKTSSGVFDLAWAGGIVFDTQGSVYCRNLVNYAHVKGVESAGGVFGRTTQYDYEVTNCINYGIVEAEYAGGVVGCASLGWDSAYYEARGCLNFGELICDVTDGSGIVGKCISIEYCFVAQTPVSTPNGYKNIEDIQIGDIVYSMNLQTMQIEEKAVKRLKITENAITSTCLISTGTDHIESTPDHRFYVKDKGWIDAYELKVGDILINEAGIEKAITDIQTKTYDKPITVYNFEVEDNRNYFVGEDNILVYTIPDNVK